MSNKKKRKWRAWEIANKQERGQTLAGDTDVVRIEWTVRPYSLGSLLCTQQPLTESGMFSLYYIYSSLLSRSLLLSREMERGVIENILR
jgi:hypothetical protein